MQALPDESANRITAVINFIHEHLKENLAIEKLAEAAHYSPFHFQKLFRQATGVSVKQYIIRLRLEHSAHALFISDRSIQSIALDSGFASNATFARAFKQYFGVTAAAFRKLSPAGKQQLQRKNNNTEQLIPLRGDRSLLLDVTVKRMPELHVAYLNAPFSDTSQIREQFGNVFRIAHAHELLPKNVLFVGLINPHQGRYRTGIALNGESKLPKTIAQAVIRAGKFATFRLTGDVLQTVNSLYAFHEQWLPQSGYAIADSNGFEILSRHPASAPYEMIEREIYIAIEPV